VVFYDGFAIATTRDAVYNGELNPSFEFTLTVTNAATGTKVTIPLSL
jgi:hypothetical protein